MKRIPWNKGKTGLQVPWNKGKLTPDDTKKKISDSCKGRIISDEAKKKISLSNIGKHTLEISDKTKDKMSKSAFKRFENKENHPRWKGGVSKDEHGGVENRQWRINIFERDNWTCQGCQKRGCYIEAHHVKSWARYPELRYELNNGVTLCKECHKLTNNYRGKNYV